MPGEATIGALRVVLGADVAKFEDNLKSAQSALADFGKKALAIATGIELGKGFEKAFSSIVESITGAIEAADKLSKASQKFGIPTDSLQVLAHAAELSNVSLETLGGSIAKLSRNMIAAEGPTSDQAAAFKALGLSVSGLIKLRPDEAFLKIADAVSKFGDGTGKTAAVQAALGKGAADLIPVLNLGSAGIKALGDRMQDLGQIISAETIVAANHFKDTLTDLGKAKESIILKIIGDSGLLAAMQKLADSFIEAGADSKKFNDNFGPLVDFIRNSINEFEMLAAAIDKLKTAIPAANAAAEEGTKAWLGFEYGIEGVGQAVAPIPAIISTAGNEVAKSAAEFAKLATGMNAAGAAAKAFAPQLDFSPTANKNLIEFEKHLQKIRDQGLDASGVFAGQLAPGFLAASAGMEILKGQITIVGDQFVRLGPLAQKLNDEMLRLQGIKLTQDFLTPWQQYEQQLQRIDLLLAHQQISLDTYTKQAALAATNMQVAYATTFNNIALNAASAFKDLASVSHEFAAAAKAAAIAQATIATYLGAAQAYTQALPIGGIPLAILAAGVATAAGLANVAKIVATPFAGGGSFKVPGGVGGLDRLTSPIALAPGERVDITPASQVRDRGGRPREIVLSGIGPRDFFTGDMLRGLVDALNQGQRDGYRLKVAT